MRIKTLSGMAERFVAWKRSDLNNYFRYHIFNLQKLKE